MKLFKNTKTSGSQYLIVFISNSKRYDSLVYVTLQILNHTRQWNLSIAYGLTILLETKMAFSFN